MPDMVVKHRLCVANTILITLYDIRNMGGVILNILFSIVFLYFQITPQRYCFFLTYANILALIFWEKEGAKCILYIIYNIV